MAGRPPAMLPSPSATRQTRRDIRTVTGALPANSPSAIAAGSPMDLVRLHRLLHCVRHMCMARRPAPTGAKSGAVLGRRAGARAGKAAGGWAVGGRTGAQMGNALDGARANAQASAWAGAAGSARAARRAMFGHCAGAWSGGVRARTGGATCQRGYAQAKAARSQPPPRTQIKKTT